QDKKNTAPLVLWLQGGPGKSAMYGQYLEVGPVGLNATGGLYARTNTIQSHANVIFLDQPTGAGLSVLPEFNNTNNYAKTLDEMAVSIEKFMSQFLIFFGEYRNRTFFVAGESYGARAAVGFAERLRCNSSINRTDLPLAGVMLGSGFLAPLLDLIDSSEFLYNVRLLDEIGRNIFKERFLNVSNIVKTNITLALGLLSQTVLNLKINNQSSLFQMLAGFTDHGNAINPLRPPEASAYYKFANTTNFTQDLHVAPGMRLDVFRPFVAMMLGVGDYFVSVEEKFRNVLEYQHVLLYTAQLDDVFPSVTFDRYFRNMSWNGSQVFREATKQDWNSCEATPRLLGYVTNVKNLTYATVLRAGHHTARDQPYSVYDLMSRFIQNTSFAAELQC
ncbi:unnamed protein product, partial [Ixodes hexagonus]